MDVDLNKGEYTFDDLNMVIGVLLGENGCPWDKAQTHMSVRECLMEECYEAIDAVNQGDKAAMCEEFGDVLMQVVFNAKLAEKAGDFTIDDVVDGVCRKMISRHTHIFGGDAKALSPEDALVTWEKNKKTEKGYASVREMLELVPHTLPALIRAQKVQKKAAKTMERDMDGQTVLAEAEDAFLRLKQAVVAGEGDLEEYYGAFLFKSAQISRFLKINPEFALTNAVETYINKFEHNESANK